MLRLLLVACFAFIAAAPAPAEVNRQPVSGAAPFAADDNVQVTGTLSAVGSVLRGLPITPQMFGAKGDSNGTTDNGSDDTAAFQAAVAFAQDNGLTLRIPGLPMADGATVLRGMPRMYRLTAPVTITKRLVVDGDFCQPYRDDGSTNTTHLTPGPGSWLFFDHPGKGVTAPSDGLGGGATGTATGQTSSVATTGVIVRGVCSYRAQPALVASGSWAPADFGFDFAFDQDDVQISDVVMLNPTRGLSAQGRFTAERLRIGAYLVGVEALSSADVPRLNDIHVWPFGAAKNGPAGAYARANMEGLRLGRVDNPDINGLFVIGARFCIHVLGGTYPNVANKVAATNVDCDLFGNTGLLIEANGSSGQVTNFRAQGWDTGSYSAVNIGGSNNHWGILNARSTDTGGAAFFVGPGAGNWLSLGGFVNVERWSWGGVNGNSGTAAIDAQPRATIVVNDNPLFAPTGQSSVQYGGGGTVYRPTYSKVN